MTHERLPLVLLPLLALGGMACTQELPGERGFRVASALIVLCETERGRTNALFYAVGREACPGYGVPGVAVPGGEGAACEDMTRQLAERPGLCDADTEFSSFGRDALFARFPSVEERGLEGRRSVQAYRWTCEGIGSYEGLAVPEGSLLDLEEPAEILTEDEGSAEVWVSVMGSEASLWAETCH